MLLKTGKEVQNEQDVRNLIVSVILRTCNWFTIDEIEWKVNMNLRESPFFLSSNIKKLVEEALELFQRDDIVYCKNGKFQLIKKILIVT